MITLSLCSPEDTTRLGRALARLALAEPALRAFLLRGPLGSGKTTLTRDLVTALPGGERAEVSSPSFTICNHYPTTPPVLHCDLYRAGSAMPDEIWDALEDGVTLSIVEWAEHMPQDALPEEFLDIQLQACHEKRLVTVEPHGSSACRAALVLQHDDWMRQ